MRRQLDFHSVQKSLLIFKIKFCGDNFKLDGRYAGKYGGASGSGPNLAHRVHDEFELGPLLILGQQIALRRRSETALRA